MKKWFTQLFILGLVCTSLGLSAQQVLVNYDFDGGLQGWESNTISLDSVWQWSPDGSASQGAFAAPDLFINSPTASNGCARFNSDFYITQGDQNNAPTGPPDTYPKFICEFISPVIDLSGVTGPVSLRFSQVMRPLNLSPGGEARTSFSISADNGVTWTPAVDCNEGVPVNATVAQLQNGTVTFPISGVQGSSQVRIKFTYAMDFYFWLIDDVQLILRDQIDMQANDNFFAIPHNAQTPASHVEDIRFLCDIENVGGFDAENVNLNITILDDQGNTVYTVDQPYGTIGIDSLAENVIVDGSWTPPASEGSYTGFYSVSADGTDGDTSNDSISFNFEVTSNLFAKDLGPTRSVAAADDNSFSYGNHYIIRGAERMAESVSFGLTFNAADRAAAAGRTITVWLYEWNDENGDALSQESERIIRGLAIYDITGTEDWRNDPLIEVPLEGFGDDSDLVLNEGTSYIVALEYVDDPSNPVTCFYASADNVDYNAMVFLHDSINDPRYAGMLDVGVTGEFSSLGFGYDLVPIAQLRVSPVTGTNDIELADEALTLFPNPASHIMNVDINLEEAADEVNLVIYTVDGKKVFSDRRQNVQSNTFEYNVSNLPNGSYMMHMTIDGAFKTKSFTVAR
jgi:hypothetical protein